MNLEHLNLFVRIATLQNISQAGADLGLSAAVASAQLQKLESTLGVRLLHRSTRNVTLSEEGEAFLPHAKEVLASAEAARAAVGAGSSAPSGTLRMTASASFGRQHLIPAIASFMEKFEQVEVDLRLSDTIVDLVEGGFDLALRNAPLKDSTLVARRLARDRRIICASPDYLQKYGTPEHPQDLTRHYSVSLHTVDCWSFTTPDGPLQVHPLTRFRTDNGEAMRDACCAGLGVTINSTWNCYQHLRDGRLVEVLADYPLEHEAGVWAVYPTSRLLAPKVRAMIDHLLAWFGDTPYWDRPQ